MTTNNNNILSTVMACNNTTDVDTNTNANTNVNTNTNTNVNTNTSNPYALA